ncbi:MAG TPA: Mth938-like domain-containing protein [Candidatus Cybelea sp.]|nr:Mth938-like domain-containing protein [Candidatus Cybelea sp.]
MDLTPLVPQGRQIVESYGEGRFRVTGTLYQGSVLVFPDRTAAWSVAMIADLSEAALTEVAAAGKAGTIDLLLIGCGLRMTPISSALRAGLRAQGVVIETMDTGAAARTYNVLAAEGRKVAAALIAV